MLITQITDHVQAALDRLLQQYHGKPNIAAVITALVDPIQDLEDAIFGVAAGTLFYNGTTYPAAGTQLDNIGTIVGIQRNGLTDAEYLIFIIGQIVINNSDGSIPVMLNAANIFFDPALLLAFDMYPAEFNLEIAGSTLDSDFYTTVATKLQQALGAGIGLGFMATFDETNAFRCSRLTGEDAVIRFSATPTSGTFTLKFGLATAGPFNYNVAAGTIQTAVQALHGLSAVTVSGSVAAGFTFNWGTGAVVPITVSANSLSPTTAIAVTDSVVITPGTGGGCSSFSNTTEGGALAATIFTNQGA